MCLCLTTIALALPIFLCLCGRLLVFVSLDFNASTFHFLVPTPTFEGKFANQPYLAAHYSPLN
jgi:hypothetical protein